MPNQSPGKIFYFVQCLDLAESYWEALEGGTLLENISCLIPFAEIYFWSLRPNLLLERTENILSVGPVKMVVDQRRNESLRSKMSLTI